MITAHALTAEMAASNRMVTAIHNEQVQRVARDSSSDHDDFSDRRRSINMYWETIKHFG